MNRKAALVVSGLLICCMNSPLPAYAAVHTASDGQTSASVELAGKKKHFKHFKKRHKLDVDALVKGHVISKETGEKIKAYLKAQEAEYKAEREKTKGMTDEERRAYFREKYPNGKPTIWTRMTADGVITQEEADAIQAALQAKHECERKGK